MAVTQIERLSYSSAATQASYTTSSAAPVGNRLLLLHVSSSSVDAGVTPAAPPTAVTGCGVTWVLVDSQVTANGNLCNSVWRAMGAAPTTGTLNITFASNSANLDVRMVEFAGVVTSGTNGSGAIRQTNKVAIATTTPSTTLSSSIVAGNATAGFMSYNAAATNVVTAGTGYTKIGSEITTSSPANQAAAEWRAAGSTTVNFTTGNASAKALIGLEIVAGASNVAPTADAGPDQLNAEPYTRVDLNGGSSSDPDGSVTGFAWTQVSGPTVVINNPNTATPWFIMPATEAGATVVLQLIVTDNLGAVSTGDNVTVTGLPWDKFMRVGTSWVPKAPRLIRVGTSWV